MVVVADTSPINYLILTGYVDVLPGLHGDVVLPQAVTRELRDPRTPERVRQWITAPPVWCSIQHPHGPADPTLADLGDGEREAILLCQELGADALWSLLEWHCSCRRDASFLHSGNFKKTAAV